MKKIIFLSLFCTIMYGADLEKEINNLLKKLHKHTVGIKIVNIKNNTVLYQKNDTTSLVPASALKLITVIAGLHFLGPNYQFKTSLTTNGFVKDGVLYGNICLYGSGDPSFRHEDLKKMVTQIKNQGIKKITGSIIVDATIFDNHFYAPGTAYINTEWRYAPAAILPVCGINIDHNYKTNARRAIKNPAYHAGNLLYTYLKNEHISVKKQLFMRKAAHTKILATHNSLPLKILIQNILKDSDNLYADCLFKAIAAHESTPATWTHARFLVTTFFTHTVRSHSNRVLFFDGSGISDKNRFTPHDFIELLIWARENFIYFNDFFNGLAKTGVDGTVKKRIRYTNGSTVHAKTGTKSGISSLVGYCLHYKKDPIAFAIMIKGPSSPAHKNDVEDAIIKTVLKCRDGRRFVRRQPKKRYNKFMKRNAHTAYC